MQAKYISLKHQWRPFASLSRRTVTLLFLIICFNLKEIPQVLAADAGHISLEFHIAADPYKDAAIVKLAVDMKGAEVKQDLSLDAKWLPVAKNATPLPDSNKIVTRSAMENGREILVLITDDDIVDSKILKLSLSKGQYGETTVQANVDDSGNEPGFYSLTKDKIGRYIVAAADGQALNALPIVNTLYDIAVIPGAVGTELAGRISSDPRFVKPKAGRMATYGLAAAITILCLVVLGGIIGLSRKRPSNSE